MTRILPFLFALSALMLGQPSLAVVNVQEQPDGNFHAAVWHSGSAAMRYDIVIVGDGFSEAEQDDFNARAADVLTALQARAPFNQRMCGLNIWRVNVVSNESGVDKPAMGIVRDTELDVRYGDPAAGEAERCIRSDSPAKVWEAAGHAPEADAVFVLANDTQWGGCAGGIVYSSISPGFDGIVTHELGHKIGALADEYTCYLCDGSDSDVAYSGSEPGAANCTIASTHGTIKWNDLIDPATPLPTSVDNPAGVVGIWPGCQYRASGIFRPQSTCHMRTTGSEFCAVCKREMRQALGNHCTACERSDTPLERFACLQLPDTLPPWWVILGLRWPIPVCLSCPPFDFRDRLEIYIPDLGLRADVIGRIVDEAGRTIAEGRQSAEGLRIAFDARRGDAYWLELNYPAATRLSKPLAPQLLHNGQQVRY
jgi:hypothetical protein